MTAREIRCEACRGSGRVPTFDLAVGVDDLEALQRQIDRLTDDFRQTKDYDRRLYDLERRVGNIEDDVRRSR